MEKSEPSEALRPRRDKLRFARLLRRRQTPAEKKLWSVLRNRGCAGEKFRRQVPFGSFIADFYSHHSRLILEIDGEIHRIQQAYDAERQRQLKERGYRILRFQNEEILDDLPRVLETIAKALGEIRRQS